MKQPIHIQYSYVKDLLHFCEKGNAGIVRLARQNFIVNLVTLLETYAVQHALADQDDSLLDGHFTCNLLLCLPSLSDSDKEMIKNIVDIRNSIVHGDGCQPMSMAELHECIRLTDKIIDAQPNLKNYHDRKG